nr:hypothetical protein [Archangium primigenium]
MDPVPLSTIVEKSKLGDPNRLPEFVGRLRPDITDTKARVLFEIKPDNAEGRAEARLQAGRYLEALNAAIEPHPPFTGGTGFDGSLFLDFEQGGALWQLSWRTPEPGVTLYRWSYRRKRPGASWKERAAQAQLELPFDEVEKRGQVVEQLLRDAFDGGSISGEFPGDVYLPVDCH